MTAWNLAAQALEGDLNHAGRLSPGSPPALLYFRRSSTISGTMVTDSRKRTDDEGPQKKAKTDLAVRRAPCSTLPQIPERLGNSVLDSTTNGARGEASLCNVASQQPRLSQVKSSPPPRFGEILRSPLVPQGGTSRRFAGPGEADLSPRNLSQVGRFYRGR
jgi:hypothetical protein